MNVQQENEEARDLVGHLRELVPEVDWDVLYVTNDESSPYIKGVSPDHKTWALRILFMSKEDHIAVATDVFNLPDVEEFLLDWLTASNYRRAYHPEFEIFGRKPRRHTLQSSLLRRSL